MMEQMDIFEMLELIEKEEIENEEMENGCPFDSSEDTTTWCLPNEEWRDMDGKFVIDGIDWGKNYQCSNLGRFRSKDRMVRSSANPSKKFTRKGKILKQWEEWNGYLRIALRQTINGKQYGKRFISHRIIATIFHENLENKEQVNHINGWKHDNRAIINLEWNTTHENNKHKFDNELQINDVVHKTRVSYSKGGGAILALKYDKNEYGINEFIGIYPSQLEAARQLNVSAGNVTNVLKGRYKHTGGYTFKYLTFDEYMLFRKWLNLETFGMFEDMDDWIYEKVNMPLEITNRYNKSIINLNRSFIRAVLFCEITKIFKITCL